MHEAISFLCNDAATTEIYTLSLRDALPISGSADPATVPSPRSKDAGPPVARSSRAAAAARSAPLGSAVRSEEHTSELQSRPYLVCRLLLEKKKQTSEIH